MNVQPQRLPHLRYEQYMNSTLSDDAPDFEKNRQLWDLSYQLGRARWSVYRERTLTLDRNLEDTFNRNRRREQQGGRAEWQQSNSVQFSTELSREFSYVRDDLFPVDGLPIAFGPWQRSEIARTGTVGLTLRPARWLDASGNFSRRVLVQGEASDLETNLADFQARLAPWHRAFDLRLRYEIDKKLETEKEEIYTNVLFGRELEPGEGTHVRLDEYHYQRDSENGDFVRILRTLGDRPVASVETSVQLSLSPARSSGLRGHRSSQPPEDEDDMLPTPSLQHRAIELLRQSIDASVQWEVVEEQENAGTTDLYLLRNLQASHTLLGRDTLRYRLGVSPVAGFRLGVNHSYRDSLDRRFDSRERTRDSEESRYSLELDVNKSWTFQTSLERRQSAERLVDLGIGGGEPLAVSDLSQDQRMQTASARYRWNTRWSGELEFQRETEVARDPLADENATETETFAAESRLSYAWPGKGRLSLNYRAAWGSSQGNLAVARYNFYDGLSHELRCQLEYRTQRFTDLQWRVNYRLRITEQEKPDHRAQMEVAAEL